MRRKSMLFILYQVCLFCPLPSFFPDKSYNVNKDGPDLCFAGTFFRIFLCNNWTQFEIKQVPPAKFVFSGSFLNKDNRLGPWLTDVFWLLFFDHWWNLSKPVRNQALNILSQRVFFQTDPSTNMVMLASNWLIHFRLFLCSHWTDFFETYQEQ